jgi:DNA-binding transcriptional ArsR family regulator
MRHEDAELIAADLVRALRGRRSRAAFSQRLGYGSNVVHRWESAAAWPSAARFLTRIARVDARAAGALARFVGRPAPETPRRAATEVSQAEVAGLLRELRGNTPVSVLAERTGYSRFRVSRWLKGGSAPRLPELLCLVEAASRRLLDLLAELVDPRRMPTVAPRYRELLAARESAYDAPWSHAVLRALELTDSPRKHDPRWIAERLGISQAEVERGLSQLVRGGQATRRAGGRYSPTRVQLVDTRADPVRARGLKAHWARTARSPCGGRTRSAGVSWSCSRQTATGAIQRAASRRSRAARVAAAAVSSPASWPMARHSHSRVASRVGCSRPARSW